MPASGAALSRGSRDVMFSCLSPLCFHVSALIFSVLAFCLACLCEEGQCCQAALRVQPASLASADRELPLPCGSPGRFRIRFHRTSPGHVCLLRQSLWGTLLPSVKGWCGFSPVREGGDPEKSQGEMTRQSPAVACGGLPSPTGSAARGPTGC